MQAAVRDLVEGQIIVVVLADGTETHVMIKEKYPLDMDGPDGEYGLHLTDLGLMHYSAARIVTVVEWS